jgi:hypothetical protein
MIGLVCIYCGVGLGVFVAQPADFFAEVRDIGQRAHPHLQVSPRLVLVFSALWFMAFWPLRVLARRT